MNTHQRVVAGAGILFVILYGLPIFLWGGVRPDEPASQVAADLMSHRGAAVASAYLLLGASVALLIFAVGITRTGAAQPVSQLLSATGLGAGVMAATLLAAANAVMAALAGYLVSGSTADSIRSLNGVWDALETASGLFLGVLLAISSLMAFETRRMAIWMRWAGLVAGAVLVVGAGSVATPFHGLGVFWVVGVFASLIWIAITSVWMLIRP